MKHINKYFAIFEKNDTFVKNITFIYMGIAWEKIIVGINEKDRNSYEHLYTYYYPNLCHYAAKILNTNSNEEDVVQEVLIALWESNSRFEHINSLTTYLYRSVYNKCINILRGLSKQKKSYISAENIPLYEDFDNQIEIMQEEWFRVFYSVIDKFSEERKNIFFKCMEGKSNKQIAEELGISVNTVKTLKKKIYAYLKENMPKPLFLIIIYIMENNII